MDPQFDLVIRRGTIIDGSGGDPREGDVAVSGGKFAAIGSFSGAGVEEIDAKGCIVTPGFVDTHTHYDGQVTWENRLGPSSNHGTTTVVMGNCGVGFAPCRPDQHELVIRLMEGVEDIPGVVMAEGCHGTGPPSRNTWMRWRSGKPMWISPRSCRTRRCGSSSWASGAPIWSRRPRTICATCAA